MGSIVNTVIGGKSGNTGGAGMNYEAGATNLQTPTTMKQAQDAYTEAQNTLNNQNAFLGALQNQNALGNQTSVYNQLQGVANGTGPNPAQAMLNNSTGQNVANQTAMMASQRGSGANPALMARQAAMQGANTQQQAAGQGAALQANQSLGALNQMGGLATNQANQYANAMNADTNAAQGLYGLTLGGINNQNQAQNASMGSQNAANAGVSSQVAGSQGKFLEGITGGIAKGVTMMADGGQVAATPLKESTGPTSGVGKFFQQYADTMAPQQTPGTPTPSSGYTDAGAGIGKGISSLFGSSGVDSGGSGAMNPAQMMASGGKVPAMVSPGEQYLAPKDVEKVKKGSNPLKVGEHIPGKPKVKGNSYTNDTVPKTLEAGGIVIPNSIMQSKDAAKKAAEFVAAHLKQKSLKKK